MRADASNKETLSDAYGYLLGRTLVIRQEHMHTTKTRSRLQC